ncbi:hypothetical protein [Pseudomonas putida]|uniref:hypothetical protein n=1 Tax=Pseudomonas putida TaxID=303 RepID=UPI003D98D605
MSVTTVGSARLYLSELSLPRKAPHQIGMVAAAAPQLSFDPRKNQATVVGSEVLSFVKGVSAERRQDIVDCALLAQLAANKKASVSTGVFDWYNAYFEVLENLGWVIQSKDFQSYSGETEGLETHDAILAVAAVALGGGSTAWLIVEATIKAMKSMKKDDPWITIFNRESQRAQVSRFQIGLAQEEPTGEFAITLMAFELTANMDTTQVLFFKFHTDKFKLQDCSGKITVNDAVLTGIRDNLREKLIGRSKGFVDTADI